MNMKTSPPLSQVTQIGFETRFIRFSDYHLSGEYSEDNTLSLVALQFIYLVPQTKMETIDGGGGKKHRASKVGAKADKKKAHQKKKSGQSNERHNPKAFSVSNINRTKRTQQRNLDRGQKKEVVQALLEPGEPS